MTHRARKLYHTIHDVEDKPRVGYTIHFQLTPGAYLAHASLPESAITMDYVLPPGEIDRITDIAEWSWAAVATPELRAMVGGEIVRAGLRVKRNGLLKEASIGGA